MEGEILKLMATQGVFAILFCYLLFYVLKNNKEREEKMQITIDKNQEVITELVKKFDVVEDVKKDVEEIKNKLK